MSSRFDCSRRDGFGRLRVTHAPVMCTRSDGSKELVRAFPPFARDVLIDQLRELHAPRAIVTDSVPLLDVYHRAMEITSCFGTVSPHDAVLRRMVATRECNYVAAAHIIASILVCRKMDLHWPNEPPHVTTFLDRLTKTFQTPQPRGLTSSDIQLLNVCCVVLATDPQWADVVASKNATNFVPSPTGQPGLKRPVDTGSGSSALPAATRQRIVGTEQNEPTIAASNSVLPPGLIDELLKFMTDDLALRYIEATNYKHLVGPLSLQSSSSSSSSVVSAVATHDAPADTTIRFNGIWLRYRIKKYVTLDGYAGPYRLLRVRVRQPIDALPLGVIAMQLSDHGTIPARLEPCMKELTMDDFFVEPVVFPYPCYITHVTFGEEFDAPLLELPASVTHFTMGHEFNQPMFTLHNGLIKFTMGNAFNQPRFVIPASVTEFKMGRSFVHPLIIPPDSRLVSVSLGLYFNVPNFRLPSTVQHFTMGNRFTQPDFQLPRGLRTLKLGSNYNPLSFSLPPLVEDFEMGWGFNSPMTIEPNSRLRRFVAGHSFQQPLVFPAECQLRDFTLGRMFIFPLQLPPSVTHFTTALGFNRYGLIVPEGVTHFTMGETYNKRDLILPSTLTHLTLGAKFRPSHFLVPHNVTHFVMGGSSADTCVIEDTPRKPSRLIECTMSNSFNPKFFYLPDTVKKFTTGDAFNVYGFVLPPHLVELRMGAAFDVPWMRLPHTMKQFHMGASFNAPFTFDPNIMLDDLTVGAQYDRPDSTLPPSKRIHRQALANADF